MNNKEEVNTSLLPTHGESHPMTNLNEIKDNHNRDHHVVTLTEKKSTHSKPINLTWRNVCVEVPCKQPSCFQTIFKTNEKSCNRLQSKIIINQSRKLLNILS